MRGTAWMWRYRSISSDLYRPIGRMILVLTLPMMSAVAPDAQRDHTETSDGMNPRSVPKYVAQSRRTLVMEADMTRDGVFIKRDNGQSIRMCIV